MLPLIASHNLHNAAEQGVSDESFIQAIAPLLPNVIAQIKSSTLITSLEDVVSGLLQNSLDAGSGIIGITIDFSRGACVVEDDGCGIPPSEFREGGGLGKSYHSSKYNPHDGSGRHGNFLASLAALSLLNITSHHCSYYSTNSMIIHRSQVVARQTPVNREEYASLNQHGTRVTARDLFGNMPVRVKHRAMVLEEKAEHDRAWERVKRNTVASLIAWDSPAKVSIREQHGSRAIKLNGQIQTRDFDSRTKESCKPGLFLVYLLQASYITVMDRKTWVPVSATTESVTVSGSISTRPSPTKRVQFLSINSHVLPPDHGHNELYEVINRLFDSSHFGFVDNEDDACDLDSQNREARQYDKSEKTVQRRIKRGRKGVDRWPMFVLWISLKSKDSRLSEGMRTANENTIKVITEVLEAMVAQWLAVHHFSPLKRKQTSWQSNSGIEQEVPHSSDERRTQRKPQPLQPRCLSEPYSGPRHIKRKARESAASCHKKANTQQSNPSLRAFGEWSRIKSGKSVHRTVGSAQKAVNLGDLTPLSTTGSITKNGFHMDPILAGSFGSIASFSLGSRPSCTTSTPVITPSKISKGGGIFPPDSTLFKELLSSWKNPVFKKQELPIRSVTAEWQVNQSVRRLKNLETHVHGHDASNAFADFAAHTLTKTALRRAKVISQVDKKFILIQMNGASLPGSVADQSIGNYLVLVDQHAADERCRVEELFREMCNPASSNSRAPTASQQISRVQIHSLEKPMTYQIAFQETDVIAACQRYFASWGIIYDMKTDSKPASPTDKMLEKATLISVKSLPRAIAERCKSEPKLLISIIRREAWRRHEATSAAPRASPGSLTSPGDDQIARGWIQSIGDCPQGILELVNSRACRSAIMFNDELSKSECEDLVRRLSECAFPFQCAHGRPSMAPLLQSDLNGGIYQGISNQGKQCATLGGMSVGCSQQPFVAAYRAWQRDMDAGADVSP